ncbi:MAG TPA: hypothetical protein VGR11_03670 [Solirubrobacteraceae bacterium]|nr:hypothetical protein [Solirubrobacteraceae bacterium]
MHLPRRKDVRAPPSGQPETSPERGPSGTGFGTEERIERPRIVVFDAPSVAAALTAQRYTVAAGTFGQPFRVERSDKYVALPLQIEAPGLSEADMVIVDLASGDPVDEPPELDSPAPGVEVMWSSMRNGEVDPRPYGMHIAAQYVDRMLEHGGVLIAIASARFSEPYVLAEVERRAYGSGIGYSTDATLDNWGVSRELTSLRVEPDHGREISPTDEAIQLGFGPSMWKGRFTCTFEPYGSDAERWIPLAGNKYGRDVAGILAPRKDTREGWVILLPQVDRIDELVVDLVQSFLPRIASQIFTIGDDSAWTDDPAYEHHDVRALREEAARIRREAEADALAVEARARRVQQAQAHLHTLLTGTGDALVDAVIRTLTGLGFTAVVDVDAERHASGDKGTKREDVHIVLGGHPLVLGEVKGIDGTPKETNALQVSKYLAPRMRELNRTDLHGLSIVNHQRHLPPLQRTKHVFQGDVVINAEEQGITLLTGWELFRLARNAARHDWPFQAVRGLFYVDGRPDIIPAHYRPIGTVDKVWPQAGAFAVTLASPVRVGDRVALEGPVDFEELLVESIRLDDTAIDRGEPGQRVGVKPAEPVEGLKEGMRIFVVDLDNPFTS